MKNSKTEFTTELFGWAYMPKFKVVIENLANMAEPENWQYPNEPSQYSEYPILESYIKNTYKKLSKENKIVYDKSNSLCCFDTGLVTVNQEPIYIEFKENTAPGVQYWMFNALFRQGEYEATNYEALPDMASYYDDASKLVYDTNKQLLVNYEHIINDNKDRFPAPYNSKTDYELSTYLKGCVDATLKRVKRDYKIAIPQFHNGSIQLLLPLCLTTRTKADLVLVVEDFGSSYRAATCLTLDMALKNARLLNRPNTEWLKS